MTLLWATLALASTLEDDTGCLDALVLERELQARAPTAEADVRVTRSAEGRLVHVVVRNLSPIVERQLLIRDIECAELPRAIALIAAAALADRDILDGPSLFVDEDDDEADDDDIEGDARVDAAPLPLPAPRVPAPPPNDPVLSPVASGGVQFGVALPLFVDGSLGAGAQLRVGGWATRWQARVRQTVPVPFGLTFASLTSLALAADVRGRSNVLGVEVVPRAGLDAGGGLAWRLDGKRTAVVPRLDAGVGVDVGVGAASIGLDLRMPLLPFLLIDRELRVGEPPVWAGLCVSSGF